MTAYRRYRLKGGCYFFTVALAEQGRLLLTENIDGLRSAFREVKPGWVRCADRFGIMRSCRIVEARSFRELE